MIIMITIIRSNLATDRFKRDIVCVSWIKLACIFSFFVLFFGLYNITWTANSFIYIIMIIMIVT